jgi:hypothetical protein
VTESGNINTVASCDIEDALTLFKGKFIPVNNYYILIDHIGIASSLGRFGEGIFLPETLSFVNADYDSPQWTGARNCLINTGRMVKG